MSMDMPLRSEVREAAYGYDDRAEKVARMSDVASAQEQTDQALERLQKQAAMLEERLANYLQPLDAVLAEGERPTDRDPVPAAAVLRRQARQIEDVANALGTLRDRFEG